MDEITVKLTAIFQVAVDWMKFAEAKNAVILAFSGAGITAIVTSLSTTSKLSQSLYIGFLTSIVFLCITSLVCAISFLPKTDLEHIVWLNKKPSKKSGKSIKDTDNLYFFEELQKYNSMELLEAINKHYFENKIQLPYKKEYLDLANQIVINSKIASMKFQLSGVSVWLLIVSMCSIPSILILHFMIYRSF